MDKNVFLNLAREYIHFHDIESLARNYFMSDVSSVNLESFKNALPEVLAEFYDFIFTDKRVPKKIKEKITDLDLIENVIYVWTHAFIPIVLEWEHGPKALNRTVLVPLRGCLSDIMYASLATLRCDLSYPVLLESGEYSFLSMGEYKEEEDSSFLASDYAAYSIYSFNDIALCYGYEEAWVFPMKVGEMILLDDEESKMPFQLLDGEGYGIFEGNLDNIVLFLTNPNAKTDGVYVKDLLGSDFGDIQMMDLQNEAIERFFIIQYRYEALEALDEEYLQ